MKGKGDLSSWVLSSNLCIYLLVLHKYNEYSHPRARVNPTAHLLL